MIYLAGKGWTERSAYPSGERHEYLAWRQGRSSASPEQRHPQSGQLDDPGPARSAKVWPIYLANTPGTPPAIPIGSGLGVKLTVIDVNGDPWPASKMSTYFDDTLVSNNVGELTFGLKTALPTQSDGVTLAESFRLDYTIDWGNVNASLASQLVRGTISFPDDLTLAVGNQPSGTSWAISRFRRGARYPLL